MEHGFINLTPENIMDEHKGHGYGRQLMEYCLNDAKERGKSGVCMAGGGETEGLAVGSGFRHEVRL